MIVVLMLRLQTRMMHAPIRNVTVFCSLYASLNRTWALLGESLDSVTSIFGVDDPACESVALVLNLRVVDAGSTFATLILSAAATHFSSSITWSSAVPVPATTRARDKQPLANTATRLMSNKQNRMVVTENSMTRPLTCQDVAVTERCSCQCSAAAQSVGGKIGISSSKV